MTITESELLTELRKATAVDDAPPDAMTVTELAKALGVSPALVLRKIGEYRNAGRLKEYRVNRYDAQGRPHRATAFVLLPATESEKPKRKRA